MPALDTFEVNDSPNLRSLKVTVIHRARACAFVGSLIVQTDALQRVDLSMSNITDETLQEFISGCTRLKSVTLGHCRRLTDVALKSDSLSEISFSSCQNMRSLDVVSSSLETILWTHRHDALERATLKYIPAPLPPLFPINLPDNDRCPELRSFLPSDSNPALTSLHLESNRVQELHLNCPLTNLVLNAPNLISLLLGTQVSLPSVSILQSYEYAKPSLRKTAVLC